MAGLTRRLLLALLGAYALMAAFTALVYRADLRTTAGALLGMVLMLALAVSVAWAESKRN